jgi:hypothetical protein
MPTIQIETDQLLEAALQMPSDELERFVAKLVALKAGQAVPSLSEKEAGLLMEINQGLPRVTQDRLNELIRKRQDEMISDVELQELKQLADKVEKLDVERLKLLTELAALRGTSVRRLIKALGLKPVPHG